MKKIILITEEQLKNIVDDLIFEQQEKVYTDFDNVYDYKLSGNRWYTKKKASTTGKWYDITNRPVAVDRLNKRYGTNVKPTTGGQQPNKPTFKPVGPAVSDVTNIPKSPTQKINIPASKGKPSQVKPTLPKSQTQKSDSISDRFVNKIDYNKLSPSKDTVKICTPGSEDCAQFVNDFSNKINYVGNAWLAYRTDAVGQKVWSVFDRLNNDEIKSYINIYQKIKTGQGETVVPKIKALEQTLIAQAGKPSNLQVDDVVGLYYPPSSHHMEAFIGSAEQGKGFYPDGKPGKTLLSGIGHTFNTHVGIVGAIKDGVPLIFHNVNGNVISTPLNLANVVWVKRPV